ncbi:MAG: DUF58 domain-containing protein [Oscillatoriales cyanobacterium]|nr:MAG: DUF58 domain-containing protein [Oscillatoriales cyanobacterium]
MQARLVARLMQGFRHRWQAWVTSWETRAVGLSFSGALLGTIALFFFGAATNAMAGWLYVMSGVLLALMAVAAVLTARSLGGLTVTRSTVAPISVDDVAVVDCQIHNPSGQARALLQWVDRPPAPLSPAEGSIALIPAQGSATLQARFRADRRGIYRWPELTLRSGAPFGLFWKRQAIAAPAKVVVYPRVWPLSQCPIVDWMGEGDAQNTAGDRALRLGMEGLTRSLRPYRWGDSTRLIHWRSSARFGELQIRELETAATGPDLIVALDSAIAWNPEDFEQAVEAAASIYVYASRCYLDPFLWTAATGLVRGRQVVLETLAGTQAGELTQQEPPTRAVLWLTTAVDRVASLPDRSRWLLWLAPGTGLAGAGLGQSGRGLTITRDRPIAEQLQAF